jgi:hypothetical protein
VDFAGQRWGNRFLRWGILPFHFQSTRLARVSA